jgi:hypothetical protein
MGDERENEFEERGGGSADHLPAQSACCMVQRRHGATLHVAASAWCNVGMLQRWRCNVGMLQVRHVAILAVTELPVVTVGWTGRKAH